MPSAPISQRPTFDRTLTWPPTIRVVADASVTHEVDARSVSAISQSTPSPFEEDLQDHPEDHFLSPAYEHEDWTDDSDDDGDEIEWDAGITDFALFDDDKRRAQAGQDRLSSRWNDFHVSQQWALRRALDRTRSSITPDTTKPPLPVERMPSLTPDTSPNLRDDLELEPQQQMPFSTPRIPNSLMTTVTPSPESEGPLDDDEDLPLSLYVQRTRAHKQITRKLERPGLRHSRYTMSGKAHVWRRPIWRIYPVGEDPEAEEKAELGMMRTMDDDEGERGRR